MHDCYKIPRHTNVTQQTVWSPLVSHLQGCGGLTMHKMNSPPVYARLVGDICTMKSSYI